LFSLNLLNLTWRYCGCKFSLLLDLLAILGEVRGVEEILGLLPLLLLLLLGLLGRLLLRLDRLA
jgi:hypothetical protein